MDDECISFYPQGIGAIKLQTRFDRSGERDNESWANSRTRTCGIELKLFNEQIAQFRFVGEFRSILLGPRKQKQ